MSGGVIQNMHDRVSERGMMRWTFGWTYGFLALRGLGKSLYDGRRILIKSRFYNHGRGYMQAI